MKHFTVYNAEIFLWPPLTQSHGWLRDITHTIPLHMVKEAVRIMFEI